MFRHLRAEREVLLVLPGGPYWRGRDLGAWQIPKGGIDPDEAPAAAARREVQEELGLVLTREMIELGEIRQAGGKRVVAFALEHDFDCAAITSNAFEMEWPPRSGMRASFPEVEAARWFTIPAARAAMLPSQLPLLDRLEERLG